MTYYAFGGTFDIAGTSPDGDTIRFRPDDEGSLQALEPRAKASGLSRTIPIRLEAVDAPELHYEGKRQRLSLTARARLLRHLAISSVHYAAQWALRSPTITAPRGWVIARHIDTYGRMIGFVYRGSDLPLRRDGVIKLDRLLVAASANARMLATGAAYPIFYRGLPRHVHEELIELAIAARRDHRGVWACDASRAFAFEGVRSIADRGALVLPKLFRRGVAFCRSDDARDVTDARAFVRWAIRQEDALAIGARRTNLGALLRVVGRQVRLIGDPIEMIFEPKGG
jgi:endonuclease YncB( thermonuclease family)